MSTIEMNMIGYEDDYTIHSNGNVFSKIRNRFLTKNLRNGYYYVTLKDNTKHTIHKLIAKHFLNNDNNTYSCVDHLDRNKLNNDISNLRLCTHIDNSRNRSKHKNNKTGAVGVSIDKRNSKYKVSICDNYKYIYLGTYNNIKDALISRINAEQSIFKTFRNPINSFLLSIIELK